jgi:hypothetical protein
MQALVSPFPDSLRQPPDLFAGKIRCRVLCTKRFCCSAAKPTMHICRIESLRVFGAVPHYLCTCNDRELRFSHDLAMPVFGHLRIVSLPHLAADIRCVASIGERAMGTPQDHRKCAEECFAMAQAAEGQNDKAVWLTLAQSWVRLAEHVARARGSELDAGDGEDVLAAPSSD